MRFTTKILVTYFLFTLSGLIHAQNAAERSLYNIDYSISAQIDQSHGKTPFWLTSNRYGLSSFDRSNGLLRIAMAHQTENDSLSKWRIGYGVDLAVGYNQTSTLTVQQLYADLQYKLVRLSLGAKQQPLAFKNAELSTGSQTLGINARPVPALRLELPEYWNISGKSDFVGIRGHISYGMMTDGGFQEDRLQGTNEHYIKKALLHTKAGYMRIGNVRKFPLVLEGGLEMATEFGGTAYYIQSDKVNEGEPVKMGNSLKDFFHATFSGGGDITDGEGYSNSMGNMLGSWVARLSWNAPNWSISTYYDHYFEDHSEMFLQYGWFDGMVGIEAHLPKNRFVDALTYEYIKTTYQSGPVYHDHTEGLPDQISGTDHYYNHNIYQGWQHWGQAIGNPLFLSPLYSNNKSLFFPSTRFKANHIGISGNPTSNIHYRLLYTHQRSLGTYSDNFPHTCTANSMLVECCYSPTRIGRANLSGWSAKLAFALDRGDLIGNNTGFQITLAKQGVFGKKSR